MGFSLKKFLEGAAAQLNTRDGGKTFSTVMNQPKQAPAQTPAPGGMNFAGSKTYGTFNRPSTVVNLAQKQIAQTPKVNTKNRYSQVNAPSYGSGLSGILNRAKDVVDANTPQDRFKRVQAGRPEVAKPLQQQVTQVTKPIAQGFVESYNQLGSGVGNFLAQNSKDVKNAQAAQQNLATQLHQQRMSAIKQSKNPNITQPQLNRLNNLYNDLNRKDVELQQQRTNQSNELQKQLDVKRNLAALASVGFDIATLGVGTAGVQGVKQAGKAGFKAGAKELAKQAGITGSMGAASGGLSPIVQKGDQATLSDIAKGAATGFAFGAALPVASYGVVKGASSIKKPVQNAFNRLSIDNQIGAIGKNVKDNLDPLEALKAEARKYKSAEEFVKAQRKKVYTTDTVDIDPERAAFLKSRGYETIKNWSSGESIDLDDIATGKVKTSQGYTMTHRPNEDGSRAFDLTESGDIPQDMYKNWYGSRGADSDLESIAVLEKIRGNPEAEVTIYRASPSPDFNPGDWVSLSKKYAQQHADSNGSGKMQVHELKVKAKDVRWAQDDINEFGYYPEGYKKAKPEKRIARNAILDDRQQLTDLYNQATQSRNPFKNQGGFAKNPFYKDPQVGKTDAIKQAQQIAKKTEALKKQGKITPNDEGYWTTPVKGQPKDPIPNVKDVNGVQVKEGDVIEVEGLLGGKARRTVQWQEPQIANATGELQPGQWLGNGPLDNGLPFKIVKENTTPPQVGKTEPTIKAYHGSTNNKLSSLEPGAKTGLNEKRNLIYLTEDKTSASHYAKTRGTDGTGLGILSDSKTGKVYETEVTGKIIDAYNRDGGLSELKNAKGFDQLSGKTKNQLTNDTGLSGDILESNPELVKFLKDNNITAVRGHLNNTSDGATELMVVNPDKAKLAPQVGKTDLSKYGWNTKDTPKGTELYNRNGKHVATITEKKGRFTASYPDGQRIATGGDANKLAEDVARKTFYATETKPVQTGGTLRPDKTPAPYKNPAIQAEVGSERLASIKNNVDNYNNATKPAPKKAYHSTASLDIEGGKLRTSKDGAMGEGVYLHTDQNKAKYAGAMQSDGNLADQRALTVKIDTDNIHGWSSNDYPTPEQVAKIKQYGNDGIMMPNGEIVVFDANKVKLSTSPQVAKTPSPFAKTLEAQGIKRATATTEAPQVGKTGATTGKYSAQSAADRIQNQTAEMPQKPNTQLEQPEVPNKMQAKGSGDNASYLDNTPELPKYNTKKVGLLDKAFRSTRSIIERQGESGKKLAGMLQQQRDNKELWLRDIEKRLPNVQKLKDKEFENFIESTQGNASPMNLKVADAVKEWKSVHPEIRQRGVDAGLDIGDLGETYYPHFIDYEKVFKNQNTYNEAINHLVKTGQAPTQEEAIKLLSYARDISRNRQFGNLEASRIVDLPFYDKSKKSLATYLQGSADRITKTELFGKGDEKAIKLIKNIAVEGGDTEAAKNAFDVAVGAKQYNPTASKISGGIRHYTTVTRLGLGALTNLSQSVNTGIVTGHLRTLGAVAKQLSPKARQFAEDTGVISDAILDDIKRGVGYESFGSSVFGKGVNFITAPGFKQVEAFNRRVAATAGKDYALRLAQKGDEATLRKLGVTGAIKNNTLTDAQQIQAARKIVEKTQFKVDPQDLPGWADSPGGKLVAQFRTFSYNQGKFFSNEILKPMRKGNFMPLARLMAALPVGYALYESRRMIDGRPEEENKLKRGLAAFQKIGGAGLAMDAYFALNPLNSKYLPPDRRVSMATSFFGGPSVGTAMNAVGSLSDMIQRKNTPTDPSRLEGKIALGNNGDTYTDATSMARFGMQQIPVVGSPIMNRVLPYKKSAEADAGKATQSSTPQLSLDDQRTEAKNTIKKLYGKDWANMSESDIADKARNGDQKALEIYNSLQAQEKVYAKPNMPTPGLSKDAEDILNSEKKFTTTGRKAWGNRPTESKVVKETLKSWTGVDLPVTNDVAVEWAKFKQKQAKGEFSPLEENEAKLSLARKAVSSQLSEDERQYYNVADDKLLDALSKGWIKPDSLAKAMDIDKQLLSMGLTSKSGFGKKIWNALGIAYPSVSGASSGTRRSSGRRSTRTAKAPKLKFTTTRVKNRQKSFNSSLRKLLASAKV